MCQNCIKDFEKQYKWLVDKSQGDVKKHSHKKLKWKCDKCGYVWAAEVASVVGRGTGCPNCAGKVVVKGVNDLWTTHPDVARRLVDPDDGYRYSQGSAKKVDWKCDKCGYVWSAMVNKVAQAGTKCPVCTGRKVVKGLNDLWITNPEAAAKLVDRELGHKVVAGSHIKVEYYCTRCGRKSKTSVNNLVHTGDSCQYCRKKKVICEGYIENNLWKTHPEVAQKLVNPEDGYKVSYGSHKKLEWKCEKCGQTWEASVKNRVKGRKCPVCSNKKVVVGVNDLWTVRPDVARQLADPADGYKFTYGANQVARWHCDKCGCDWDAVVRTISNGIGCPVCSNKKVVVGVNDLWTTHPDVAAKLLYKEDGYNVCVGSNKKVQWKCEYCGHVWWAVVAGVVFRHRGCPVCSNKKVVRGVNDLWTTYPNVAEKLLYKEDGYNVCAGSNKKVQWKFEDCGHIWSATVTSVVFRSRWCPVCSNKTVVQGINDLWTTCPEMAAKLLYKEDGYKVCAGSEKKVEWKCEKCGNVWLANVRNVVKLGSWCPKCACNVESKAEIELREYIESLGFNVETHNRDILDGKELDVFVPEKNVAFEYNGLYFHSDEVLDNRHYHRDKFMKCEEKGVQLVTIWEDDWLNRKDVVKEMVRYKLGCGVDKQNRYYARKCDIRVVDGHTAFEFLDEHHIQGRVNATYHFGLFYENDLVALLSVRSPRQNARMKRKDGQWEIQRYATKGSVVGGFSKLMKYAEKYIDGITSWISFSSNDVSDGNMYRKCDFVLDKELPDDYKYFGNFTHNIRKPKEAFQKSCFKKDDGLLYQDGLTERELAHLNNLYRVYDTGKRRWIKDVVK